MSKCVMPELQPDDVYSRISEFIKKYPDDAASLYEYIRITGGMNNLSEDSKVFMYLYELQKI